MKRETFASVIGLFTFIFVVVVFCVFQGLTFYINKDSYQFILPSILQGSKQLGTYGITVTQQFYNRSVYSDFIWIISLVGGNQVWLRIFQILCTLALGISLFVLTLRHTKSKTIALITAFLSITPGMLFMSTIISSDVPAVLCLVVGTLCALIAVSDKKYNGDLQIAGHVLIAIAISLRIEYLIVIIPLLIWQKTTIKKSLATVILAASIIFVSLLPYFSNTWVSYQLQILRQVQKELIYLVILGIAGIIVVRFFKDKILTLLGIFSAVLTLVLLIQNFDFQLIGGVLLSCIPFILILIYVGPTIFTKKKLFTTYQACLLAIILFLFIFYKTLYFQHIIVIFPFLAILFADFVKESKLPNNITLYTIPISIITLFAGYLLFYAQYKVDYAQSVGTTVNTLVSDKSHTVVYSYMPEAMYYNTRISSRILNSKAELPQEVKTVILITHTKEDFNTPFYDTSFVQMTAVEYPEFTDYPFYEENIGFNPKTQIRILERKD